MNHRRIFVLLMVQWVIAAAARCDISDPELQSWMNNSTLTFRGRIIALGESNVNGVDKRDQPMLVRVERVEAGHSKELRKFGSLGGKELTVVINPSFRLRPIIRKNMSAIFFVDPLMYETHIAVIANAFATDETVTNLAGRVQAAANEAMQKPLKDAVTAAAGVISGVVQEIRQLPPDKLRDLQRVANGRDLFSEHSPRWRIAVVRVESVLKGDPNEKAVFVIFPSTDDRFWSASPKFKTGDQGIWLLHRDQLSDERTNVLLTPEPFQGGQVSAYTALGSEDFQKNPSANTQALIRKWLTVPAP
jgi:hypothetical protein